MTKRLSHDLLSHFPTISSRFSGEFLALGDGGPCCSMLGHGTWMGRSQSPRHSTFPLQSYIPAAPGESKSTSTYVYICIYIYILYDTNVYICIYIYIHSYHTIYIYTYVYIYKYISTTQNIHIYIYFLYRIYIYNYIIQNVNM